MPLRHLNLQLSYRAGRNDMAQDLFVPCLEQSILYRRAAGYFTSFGLGLAARGVASLASRKGAMRLVGYRPSHYPLNPDYDPIPVAPREGPELVVVGEWVASID